MTGNGYSLQPCGFQSMGLFLGMAHSHTEESFGPLALHLGEVVVLASVNHLLHHHGRRHLGIVHVTQEHLGRVPSVCHEGWQHLSLLTKEQRPRPVLFQGPYRLATDHRVLPEPQMRMCVYYEFFHLTPIWSPIISCTFSTNCMSMGSLTYSTFFNTFLGLALLKSVVAICPLQEVEYCMASLSMG